ncbi:DUF6221 family protein [Actinomadura sp. 9N215]|uniref:DUF6221 family protein n=1 Tax=Actinomadura sp. 9N215 TaxID=3375150 RepID=UPI00378C7DBC
MTDPADLSPEQLIAVITRGLDKDEQAARATTGPWKFHRETAGVVLSTAGQIPEPNEIVGTPREPADARHDPSRVLGDVQAARAVVAELERLPHYAWEGHDEYGYPKVTDAETGAEVMGGAERACTCGRDAHVARMRQALPRPARHREVALAPRPWPPLRTLRAMRLEPGPDRGRREHPRYARCGHCQGRYA